MIWFVLILALIVAAIAGLFTRSLKRALTAGLITFAAGTVLSLILLFSGALGG